MGPTLLLDKSAFQALSAPEMHKSSHYFIWNRVDILYLEILGDFTKKTKTSSSRNEASILADKVTVVNSMQNDCYRTLAVVDLLGAVVEMDGKIVLNPKNRTRIDGQNALMIDETSFCEMLHRWQKGDFVEAERLFADSWGKIADSLKADGYLQCLTSNHIIIPKSTSVDELGFEIDKLLRNTNMQHVFLNMFLSYLDVDRKTKYIIRNLLKRSRYSLQKVAPYAFYCLKVFALFLGANKFDLISKQATDRIDLEYLFYLPFCHVFSSDDRLHKKLSPALMRKDQVFLSGKDLKKGIQEIESLPAYKETMNAKYVPIPPMPKESIIREVWLKTGWLYH